MKTLKDSIRSSARLLVIAGIVVVVFVAAYAFAASTKPGLGAGPAGVAGIGNPKAAAAKGPAAGSAFKSACACCGSSAPTENGVTGTEAPAAATVEAGVQKIDVDLSKGYYDPNVIRLAAGVPAEITFGQSGGCTAQVISQDLGFSEDLTGGPRTVKLPALQKGTYVFSCGMQMVFGKIVVE